MTWNTVIQLLLQYGLPLTLKLMDKWGSNDVISDVEKAELKAIAQQTPQSVMIARLTAAGIDINSPQAQALLALLPPDVTPLPGL